MKIFRKSVLFLMSALIATSACMGLSACSCSPQGNSPVEPSDNTDENHIVNITATSEKLLSRGASDFKIVYPSDANSEELMAVSELQLLFQEATDLKLPTVSDAAISEFDEENDKYIFIGDNKFALEQELVPAAEKYGRSGHVIKSVGDSIFICGAYSAGTLFGTYRFLGYILNYDYFYKDIYHIDTGVADIPLMNYDVSIVYDIDFTRLVYGYTNNIQNDFKHSNQAMQTTGMNGQTGHASVNWLPADTYFTPGLDTYHPEWFELGTNKDSYRYQLCFTARGDSEGTYDLMVQAMANSAIEIFKKDPDAYVFDCSMSDRNAWCTCEGCMAVIEKYGANSATEVLLLNDVADKIDEWMATDEGKEYAREYFIKFYAYLCITPAPNAVDDEIYLSNRIIPIIADVNMDITSSPYATSNNNTRTMYEGWGKVSKHIAAYTYLERYDEYLSPIETINDMQAWYQFYNEQNVSSIWNLGNVGEFGFATGWGGLEVYLNGKLSCDVNADVNYYIDKYFKYVYKDAADTVKQIFNEWRAQDAYNASKYPDYFGSTANYININKEEYFSKSVLVRWIDLFDKALSEVEYLKESDPDKYAVIEKMIKGERVAYDYTYFMIYRYKLPAAELVELCHTFLDDLEVAGVTRYREAGGDANDIAYIKGIVKEVLAQYEK
ncbi:MAG: DUF4838 domain-containing protein [Clostridia bacterium]|nr:DUF4838 domain-containing protein [Clostridia bacterium]